MGGRHNAYVTPQSTITTDPFKGTLLQYPQQLDLHGQTHVTNFIQKQGAAFGRFKTPFARRHGTGEGALFVAEQFALHQFLGNRPAIDRHKRSVMSR